jgi:nifR3 family TIM-barrel protein
MSIHNQFFWQNVKRPIKVLAPMAGYTDSAFRLLCREAGADVVVTELISADAIFHSCDKWKIENGKIVTKKLSPTAEMLQFDEAERPIVIQLFGKYPEKFAKAAKWISENLKPDGIDINMGCPARKVVGSDHGAALLKNPKLACEIVRAVKENTDLPVSVKTRLGWESDDEILQFAPELVDAGIDAITIHGRTYKDSFSGISRWENIYKVKAKFSDKLVVIGNGDIKNYGEIKDKTSILLDRNLIVLDGVAIGRASFGKPWIFSHGSELKTIKNAFLKKIILKHAGLAYKTKGKKGIIEFRKHLLSYLKGFPDAKKVRMEAVKVTSFSEVESLIEHFT